MKILVTGANGYIGQRLILSLLAQGHELYCLVRDPNRFDVNKFIGLESSFYADGLELNREQMLCNDITVLQGDLLDASSLNQVPEDIDVAYYLVHSMSQQNRHDFDVMEETCARNFVNYVEKANVKQVIYLGGISNDDALSRHLSSRRNVEKVLGEGEFGLTVLRAAIIIGSGSASFEIIRDLVEKLPVMLAPRWLKTRCQPIAIRNVIQYLTGVILKEETYGKVFDIGGPDILNYKEMLLGYAKVRDLQRLIISVPFMTPRLSSYWLHLITSTNYALARTLVSSLHNEVVCKNHGIKDIIDMELFSYEEAIRRTLYRVKRDQIPSSWKEALNIKSHIKAGDLKSIPVPRFGCLFDVQELEFERSLEEVRENIWKIGGQRGWYYLDWLWKWRGNIDKIFGGVGLRRGRRQEDDLKTGDVIDFWRVLEADYENSHLILYSEMKLPGEAWLEFKLEERDGKKYLFQKATFRPQGLWGRLYWYLLVPVHHILFEGMAKRIVSFED